MIKRFLKKHQLEIVVLLGAVLFYAFGFAVGKGQAEKVPVFIERPAAELTLSNETAEIGGNAAEQPTTTQATCPAVTYEEIELVATAYCSCEACCGEYALTRPTDDTGEQIIYTASGARAKAGRTIAVDPDVIPYGTEVIIDGHTYVAEDCGGAIVGNHIDVYFDSHEAACEFGRQTVTAFIKKEGLK